MTPSTPGAGTESAPPDAGVFTQSLVPETWAPIPSHPGYEASDLGRIRSVPRTIVRGDGVRQRRTGKVLRPSSDNSGHLYVVLPDRRVHKVHRLVLEAFIGPAPEGMEGCHENGDPADNLLGNLRWDTHSSNMFDRRRHGTDPMVNRKACRWGHLLAEPNLVRYLWVDHQQRACLACNLTNSEKGWMLKKGLEFDFESRSAIRYAEILAGSRGPCAKDGCDQEVWSQGKCRPHYQRWWRAQNHPKAAA